MNLPILKYTPEQDDDKLLNHEMSSDERQLFRELDAAADAVPGDQIEAIYKVILHTVRGVGYMLKEEG